MGDKKLIFFDIDNTIWTRDNFIPDSTREAFKQLRERGHLTFINSGRSRGFIFHPELLALGFDGVVSGCGTLIEYHDEVLFYQCMSQELIRDTLKICREYGFAPIIEGKDYLYLDPEEFPNDLFVQKVASELGDRMKSITQSEGNWEASKMSLATVCDEKTRQAGLDKLKENFDLIIHTDTVCELVPKGYSKASGIDWLCDKLSVDINDTYAFGDGANDLEMLKRAGIGICMGNGADMAKEAADYVTTDLLDDGIWNACRHFGLI